MEQETREEQFNLTQLRIWKDSLCENLCHGRDSKDCLQSKCQIYEMRTERARITRLRDLIKEPQKKRIIKKNEGEIRGNSYLRFAPPKHTGTAFKGEADE